MAHEEGPFKVLEWIKENAYKLELLNEMNVSATFNMGSLAPYIKDDFEDLRANTSQEEQFDVCLNPSKFCLLPLPYPHENPIPTLFMKNVSVPTLPLCLAWFLTTQMKFNIGVPCLIEKLKECTLGI